MRRRVAAIARFLHKAGPKVYTGRGGIGSKKGLSGRGYVNGGRVVPPPLSLSPPPSPFRDILHPNRVARWRRWLVGWFVGWFIGWLAARKLVVAVDAAPLAIGNICTAYACAIKSTPSLRWKNVKSEN